jgi:hypothetical protein
MYVTREPMSLLLYYCTVASIIKLALNSVVAEMGMVSFFTEKETLWLHGDRAVHGDGKHILWEYLLGLYYSLHLKNYAFMHIISMI